MGLMAGLVVEVVGLITMGQVVLEGREIPRPHRLLKVIMVVLGLVQQARLRALAVAVAARALPELLEHQALLAQVEMELALKAHFFRRRLLDKMLAEHIT